MYREQDANPLNQINPESSKQQLHWRLQVKRQLRWRLQNVKLERKPRRPDRVETEGAFAEVWGDAPLIRDVCGEIVDDGIVECEQVSKNLATLGDAKKHDTSSDSDTNDEQDPESGGYWDEDSDSSSSHQQLEMEGACDVCSAVDASSARASQVGIDLLLSVVGLMPESVAIDVLVHMARCAGSDDQPSAKVVHDRVNVPSATRPSAPSSSVSSVPTPSLRGASLKRERACQSGRSVQATIQKQPAIAQPQPPQPTTLSRLCGAGPVSPRRQECERIQSKRSPGASYGKPSTDDADSLQQVVLPRTSGYSSSAIRARGQAGSAQGCKQPASAQSKPRQPTTLSRLCAAGPVSPRGQDRERMQSKQSPRVSYSPACKSAPNFRGGKPGTDEAKSLLQPVLSRTSGCFSSASGARGQSAVSAAIPRGADTTWYTGIVTFSRGSMAWIQCEALQERFPERNIFVHRNVWSEGRMPKQWDRICFRMEIDDGNLKAYQARYPEEEVRISAADYLAARRKC